MLYFYTVVWLIKSDLMVARAPYPHVNTETK